MPNYSVGNLIKRLRKQKGLTQEELAHPLIDRATLSRIESGRAMPSKKTLEALLEKLGFNPSNTADFFLDEEMTEIQKIHNELDSYLVLRKLDTSDPLIARIDDLIETLENNRRFMKNELNQQFVQITKAMNAINKKVDVGTIRDMLREAIKISIPEFNEEQFEDYHLSKQDMQIINMIAMLYADEGEDEKSLEMYRSMKCNMDKNCIDKIEMGRNYPTIIYNMVIQLLYLKRYNEAIEFCDIGSKVCRDTRSLYYLPMITLVKANCLNDLGEKAECERLLRQVYYACDMFDNHDGKNIAKTVAKNELGVEL